MSTMLSSRISISVHNGVTHSNAHSNTNNELTLPSDWDTEMLNDEELSATSHEEAGKVLEQWQSDYHPDLDIMQVDEQIGSNLLGEEIFGAPCCSSPTGPLEELVYMTNDDEDDRFFFAPLLDADDKALLMKTASASSNASSNSNSNNVEEQRYRETWRKLEESMRRSRETRKSLTMKTVKTEEYSRNQSLHGVLSSIETSSQQLQVYLKHIQPF